MELNIGSVISNVRRGKGLTQEALADAVGVSSAAVSKWETGASYPDITLLPPLARALGLTVDALLDYHAQPTDKELHELSERLGKVFDEQGYAAGRAACEQMLHEYPSYGPLKLVIGSLYYRYLSFALGGKADPDAMIEDVVQQSLTLFEQAEQESKDGNEGQMAKALRISALTMAGRYDEAEELLDSLPGRPFIARPEQLYQTLYLARGDLDKAEQMDQRALFEQYSEAATSLLNLSAVSRRRGDMEAAQRFTDAYCALTELFQLDPMAGLQMQLTLAEECGDNERALDLFGRYIDAVIAHTFDYTDNPFFFAVQTRVPTKNELNAMNRLVLRAAEEDEGFAAIRGEKRFADALDRLRKALDD